MFQGRLLVRFVAWEDEDATPTPTPTPIQGGRNGRCDTTTTIVVKLGWFFRPWTTDVPDKYIEIQRLPPDSSSPNSPH